MSLEDTIAAIATPAGYGGISIIRVSGKNAFRICDSLFMRPGGQSLSAMKAGSICYGHIFEQGDIIDEVLVSKMKAPYTYTAEDVVEINCHGGFRAVNRVLSLILKKGARLADAGEFTKRAFLNGRIDLLQAEAVSDLILAKTELSAESALSQLGGKLSETIRAIKAHILSLLAHLEVTIEYPEYDIEHITDEQLLTDLQLIRQELDGLLKSFRKGDMLREGLKVVIAGKPNVGKSLLLNCLIEQDKAIVTDIPGTTRDIVDEYINLDGIPVRIMDTAGIRSAADAVEQIGVKRSLEMIEKADLILFVADGSRPFDAMDRLIFEKLEKDKTIIVLNKLDLGTHPSFAALLDGYDTVNMSALTQEGKALLEKRIVLYAAQNPHEFASGAMLTNMRHKTLIESALASIDAAMRALEAGLPSDFVEIDIKDCRESLGRMTGEVDNEEIIDEIFANFCLGK